MHNPFNIESRTSAYEQSGKTVLVKLSAPQVAFKEYFDWLKQHFGYIDLVGLFLIRHFLPYIKFSLPAIAQCFFCLQMMVWIHTCF